MKEYSIDEICNITDHSSGTSLSDPEHRMILDIAHVKTPLGAMFACADGNGLCLLEFSDRNNLENQVKRLCMEMNAVIRQRPNSHLDQVTTELFEYFEGQRKVFSVPIHFTGTDFRKSVWKILMNIPYGETWSYKQQAAALGNPGAVRAVAAANGANGIAIIVPCHRVIGTDGSLRGYAGGLKRKQYLLELEQSSYYGI